MGKLFGTDGIRGVVGENLTADLAFRTGKAIAAVLKEEKGRKPVITIGKDTRISSDMLESALIAGICSVGGDVMPFGVLPTPAVAYLTVLKGADAGIVISASHNPYEHNGIKVFNEKGYKLPDAIEEQVEEKILTDIYPAATHGEIGVLRHGLRQSREAYIDHLAGTIEGDLSGLRVLVDCSNGASSATAPELFGRFRCFCDFIHREPDGININNKCGSTHPERLQELVAESDADAGFAFDGDADRVIATDERGNIVDGDRIMGICAKAMKAEGRLKKDTLVVTVMSNIGLKKRMTELGINVAETKVGDRYVLEEMLKEGYSIGGEQSGHVIFLDKNTTGDGMLTAIQVLDVMKSTGRRMSALANDIPIYPQVLVNVIVDNEIKHQAMEDQDLWQRIREVEGKLGSSGRVLVRASGTEPIIRVMLEGQNTDEISDCAIYIVKVLEQKYKGKIRV